MNLKNMKIGISPTMHGFAKIAAERGWIKSDPVVKEASVKYEQTGDLFKDMICLANGLRDKGFITEADVLEDKIFTYKQVLKMSEMELLEKAHPEGDVELVPSKGGWGKMLTQKTTQEEMLRVVNKNPTGKYAQLGKVAQFDIDIRVLIYNSAVKMATLFGEKISQYLENLKSDKIFKIVKDDIFDEFKKQYISYKEQGEELSKDDVGAIPYYFIKFVEERWSYGGEENLEENLKMLSRDCVSLAVVARLNDKSKKSSAAIKRVKNEKGATYNVATGKYGSNMKELKNQSEQMHKNMKYGTVIGNIIKATEDALGVVKVSYVEIVEKASQEIYKQVYNIIYDVVVKFWGFEYIFPKLNRGRMSGLKDAILSNVDQLHSIFVKKATVGEIISFDQIIDKFKKILFSSDYLGNFRKKVQEAVSKSRRETDDYALCAEAVDLVIMYLGDAFTKIKLDIQTGPSEELEKMSAEKYVKLYVKAGKNIKTTLLYLKKYIEDNKNDKDKQVSIKKAIKGIKQLSELFNEIVWAVEKWHIHAYVKPYLKTKIPEKLPDISTLSEFCEWVEQLYFLWKDEIEKSSKVNLSDKISLASRGEELAKLFVGEPQGQRTPAAVILAPKQKKKEPPIGYGMPSSEEKEKEEGEKKEKSKTPTQPIQQSGTVRKMQEALQTLAREIQKTDPQAAATIAYVGSKGPDNVWGQKTTTALVEADRIREKVGLTEKIVSISSNPYADASKNLNIINQIIEKVKGGGLAYSEKEGESLGTYTNYGEAEPVEIKTTDVSSLAAFQRFLENSNAISYLLGAAATGEESEIGGSRVAIPQQASRIDELVRIGQDLFPLAEKAVERIKEVQKQERRNKIIEDAQKAQSDKFYEDIEKGYANKKDLMPGISIRYDKWVKVLNYFREQAVFKYRQHDLPGDDRRKASRLIDRLDQLRADLDKRKTTQNAEASNAINVGYGYGAGSAHTGTLTRPGAPTYEYKLDPKYPQFVFVLDPRSNKFKAYNKEDVHRIGYSLEGTSLNLGLNESDLKPPVRGNILDLDDPRFGLPQHFRKTLDYREVWSQNAIDVATHVLEPTREDTGQVLRDFAKMKGLISDKKDPQIAYKKIKKGQTVKYEKYELRNQPGYVTYVLGRAGQPRERALAFFEAASRALNRVFDNWNRTIKSLPQNEYDRLFVPVNAKVQAWQQLFRLKQQELRANPITSP